MSNWDIRVGWNFFWLTFPFALTLLGIWIFINWVRQPYPLPITYAQLIRQPMPQGWYKISGGILDLNRRVRMQGDEEGDSYVALRGPGETGKSPVRVLVQQESDDLENQAEDLTGDDSSDQSGAGSPPGKPAKWRPALETPMTVIGQVDVLGKHNFPALANIGSGIGSQTITVDETFSWNVWYVGPLISLAGLLLWRIGKAIGVYNVGSGTTGPTP